jgi:hypothetical protein
VRREPLLRAGVFAGLALLGLWHVSRLQSPGLARLPLALALVLALALAWSATRSRRVLAAGGALWIVGLAALVGRAWPSRAHPIAPFSTAVERIRDGGGRFSSVLLPIDPAVEPGVHALLVAFATAWLAALALVWLVGRRGLATVVLGVLPLAIASSEFPLPGSGLRVALFVALALAALAAGRRVPARAVLLAGAPLVVVALAAGGLPGVAHGSLVDWRSWGSGGGEDDATVATDVRYAWDQSYSGLHFTGDPTVVLRIRSARPSYWRVTVLDSFDGLRFGERQPDAATALPGELARVEPAPVGTRVQVQVQVGTLDEPYLVAGGVPVAYSVPRATGGGTIDANGVLRLLRPPAHGSTYDVSAVIAEPTPDSLRHPRSEALAVPPDATDATPFAGGPAVPAFGVAGREAAVGALLSTRPAWQSAYAWAELQTEGATTPYDVALQLEQALRQTHPYNGSATLAPTDPDALAHWIVSGQAGYCQMFSASMTELLRLLGVPARIAEGFDTGLYDPSSKRYVIDDRDAHAWVEAWMPGTGYVPFDPTPGHTLPDQAAIIHTGTTAQRTTPTTTAATVPGRTATAATAAQPAARGEGSLVPRPFVLVLLGLAALVLAGLVTLLVILRRRPRDGGPRVAAALARRRLAERARRRGSDPAPGISNGELAGLLASDLGLDAGAWAVAADRAAYAPLDDATRALPELEAETARLADEIGARPRGTIQV